MATRSDDGEAAVERREEKREKGRDGKKKTFSCYLK